MKKLIILFAALFLATSAFATEPLTASAAPAATSLAAPGLEKVDFSVELEHALGVSAPQDYQILEYYYPELFRGTAVGPDRVTASVLAILLGGLGVHQFYMGEIGLGILDILFCWTGIPSLIAFIDGVVWLCESDEVFYQSWLARNEIY